MSDSQNSLNDIIAMLDGANKKLEHEVFVPSLNANIVLKPLNANHTKNIVKTTVEGVLADNYLTMIMYNVLNDVIVDKTILQKLTIYDKIFILLQLRSKNIKDEIVLQFSNEGNEEKEQKTLLLSKIIDKIKKNASAFKETLVQIDEGLFKFSLNFPTITEEFQFENYLHSTKLKDIDSTNVKQMKELVAPIFLCKTAPFIKSITVNEQTIDLTARTVVERLAIFEKLPAKAIMKIIEEIDDNYGKPYQDLLKVTKIINGETFTAHIKLDAEFFVS
jgi:hypothetical protein